MPRNRNHNPKIRKSIKFIGQGAYGCVFRPFIQCKRNNKPTNLQYISKIQKNTIDIQREVEYGSLIKNIPLHRMFFAPIVDICPVDISVIPNSEVKKCDIFTKHTHIDKNTEFISSKIRFAGKNGITQYLFSISKNINKVIRKILTFHNHILKAILLLHTLESPIIHNDIKDGNVMYDDKYGNPILIDFGLSYQIKDITPDNAAVIFYTYEYYTPWCFDITLLSFISREIIRGNLDNFSVNITTNDIDIMRGLLSKFINGNEIFRPDIHIISNEEVDIFRQQYGIFLESFINKTWKSMFDELVNNALTWDNYGVSTMFLIILYDIFLSNNPDLIYQFSQVNSLSTDGNMTSWLKSYINLLKTNILTVPNNQRQSINDTKEKLIFISNNIKKNEIIDFTLFIKKNNKSSIQTYNSNNLKRKEFAEYIKEQRS